MIVIRKIILRLASSVQSYAAYAMVYREHDLINPPLIGLLLRPVHGAHVAVGSLNPSYLALSPQSSPPKSSFWTRNSKTAS